MFGRARKQAVQETEPGMEDQLVNITNKTPTVEAGRTVTSPDKVPRVVEGAEIVTGKTSKKERRSKKREREELPEGSFKHQTSLVDHQQLAEIDQNDREEPPKFDPVQESSAYSHEMPPSARGLLPPSDGDPTPPPVRRG